MGSCFGADKVQPQPMEKFERLGDSSSQFSNENIKHSKSRSCTDVFFLIFLASFLIVLGGLLVYCVINGDIYRIVNGYDQCGNVCGRLNYRQVLRSDLGGCQGLDMRDKPYLLLQNASGYNVKESSIRKMCVENCDTHPGFRPFINRCIPSKGENVVNTFYSKTGIKNFFQEAAEDLHLCWREVIYLCLIALGFSLILILLFRFLVGVVVWVVLIGVVLASILGTIHLWIMYADSRRKIDGTEARMLSDIDSENSTSYLIFAIIATVVSVIVILIIFVMRKRIQLVVQLFKEAGRALAVMPLLLVEPILTFISLVIVVTAWLYFTLWIQSSGTLTIKNADDVYYKKDTVAKVTRWYNVLAMMWMAQFVIGCQHMIIAGAVASWYFTRDKARLGTPILYSAFNLVRYHLGSVALGSFIIAVVQVLKTILTAIKSYVGNRQGKMVECVLKCCQCYLTCLEQVLKYLTMYGHSFCKGGKQAFKLLVSNALRVTVINSVGDFVLFLGKVLVVIATVLIGIEMLQHKEGLQHIWVPLALAGMFAYFVSHCFMTVYEMAIDTIFLCFCEDCEQNDGITKPYYMSKNLMEFVENSKKALAYMEKTGREGQAWQAPSTISDKVDQGL